MTDKRDEIFKPAMILMSGRALGFCATFIIPLVLVRLLDQTEFGTYKALFLIYTTVFIIAQVGMSESLYYFMPNHPKHSGSYVANTLVCLGTIGTAVWLLMWIFQEQIAGLLNNQDLIGYIPYIGLYLLFMMMAVMLETVMTVRKQHFTASFIYAATDLARACAFIAPVLFFSDLIWLLIGAVVFAVIRFIVSLVYLLRELGKDLRPDVQLLRRQLAYALPFALAVLVETAQINYHMYAVSYYFDAATFAIYAVGCLQVPLFDLLKSSTSNVMMVSMRERVLKGQMDAALLVWQDTTRKLALVFFPMVGGMLVLAHEFIVVLFTDAYERSVPVFMIWSLTMVLSTFLSDSVLRVFAMNKFLILMNLLQLVVIAASIQWFLVNYDLIGAILATLTAASVAKLFALAKVKSILQTTLRQLLPWKSLVLNLIFAALAAVPVILFKTYVDVSSLVTLLISAPIYGISYLLLMWFGLVTTEEKTYLLETASGMIQKVRFGIRGIRTGLVSRFGG